MRKTIPLKKQLTFKTNINEITSISLENTLNTKNDNIEGDIIISGAYKITETSKQVDKFEYKIPINIEIDDKYEKENIIIDIEDFYYEIINNNILDVNIEILLDNLKEKQIEQRIQEEKINIIKLPENNITEQNEIKEERCIEEEIEEQKETAKDKSEIIETKEEIKQKNTIFDNFLNESDNYSTYYIYIVREGDTIDTIINRYNVPKEKLEEYNNLNELKIGDKIIIPEKKDAWY